MSFKIGLKLWLRDVCGHYLFSFLLFLLFFLTHPGVLKAYSWTQIFLGSVLRDHSYWGFRSQRLKLTLGAKSREMPYPLQYLSSSISKKTIFQIIGAFMILNFVKIFLVFFFFVLKCLGQVWAWGYMTGTQGSRTCDQDWSQGFHMLWMFLNTFQPSPRPSLLVLELPSGM